jgi:hypothetical protein
MTFDGFMQNLLMMFPDHAKQLSAWEPVYRKHLAHLSADDLQATCGTTISRWKFDKPPKPAEFKVVRVHKSQDSRRHPLSLTSEDLFGKAMGNGTTIPDLSADEVNAWRHQNSDLFLRRLGHLKRMAPFIGEFRAAELLRNARTEEAIDAVWDDFRVARENRAPPPSGAYGVHPDAIAHAKAYDAWAAAGSVGTFRRPGAPDPQAIAQPPPTSQDSPVAPPPDRPPPRMPYVD